MIFSEVVEGFHRFFSMDREEEDWDQVRHSKIPSRRDCRLTDDDIVYWQP